MEKSPYKPEDVLVGNLLEYSDNLIVEVKRHGGSTKKFSDNTVLDLGEYIGDIQVNPIASNGKSDLLVTRDFALKTIKGLWNLAYDCETNDEDLHDVVAFHGVSDLIRPRFVQALGFSDDSLTLYRDQDKLKDEYEGNGRDIYELWLSRNQLISAKERLGELYNRF